MSFEPHIPKFQDGEFLSEAELYKLAWLPLELYRLNNQSKGHVGFFCPNTETTWNQFEQDYDALTIHNLFIISPEGIPFVNTETQRLELSEVTIDRTTLFASAYFATSSAAFEDSNFSPDLYDPEGQPIANAYQIILHWGEDTAPEIIGTTRHSVELGRMTGVDRADFRVTPLAYYPAGLPELHAVTKSATTLEGYTQLILKPTLAPSVDRSSLVDRLEQLIANLTDSFTPAQKSVSEAQLMMKAAKGFYLRLAYAKDAQNPIYQSCKGLTRRVLEHQLEGLLEGGGDALADIISSLTRHIAVTPTTGYEQIEFFRELEALFEVGRHEKLLEGLLVTERPEPSGPRIIDLNKKDG
jgi:hypothetical protein